MGKNLIVVGEKRIREMALGKEEKKNTKNTVPTQNASPKVKDEMHSHPTFLSYFILWSQDG